MGNNNICQGAKNNKHTYDRTMAGSLVDNVKSFIHSDKSQINKIVREKTKSECVINSKSNLNYYIDNVDVIELCANFVSIFGNNEISKVHNENIYISMLFPNLYEDSEEKDRSPNLFNSHNVPVLNNNYFNYNLLFASTIIEKVNDMFCLNTDVNSNEKQNKYKFSIHSINTSLFKDLFNTLNNQSMQNLNTSSNLNDINEGPGSVSRMQTRKFSRVNTKRSNKEIMNSDEDSPTRNNFPKKKSSNSIKNGYNIIDSPQKKSTVLNQINEFDFEKELLENDFNDDENLKTNKLLKSKEFATGGNKQSRNPSPKHHNKKLKVVRTKRASYSYSIRKKLFKKIENKNRYASLPKQILSADLFNSNEGHELNFEFANSSPLKNYVLKNFKYKLEKNKKNKKFEFYINIKDMIKQEIIESLKLGKSPLGGRENGSGKNNQKEKNNLNQINSSDLFRDSVEKYLELENSYQNTSNLYIKLPVKKKLESKKLNPQLRNNNIDNNENKNLAIIDMISNINISNIESHDLSNRRRIPDRRSISQIEENKIQQSPNISQETISNNLAMLKNLQNGNANN